MNIEEIIEMATQAGMLYMDYIRVDSMKQLEAFAKLVAKREREACAKVCESYQDPFAGNAMADAIRARGKA